MEKKRILRSESGSLSLVFTPLLVCGVLILFMGYQNSKLRNLKMRERMRMLLCEKSMSTATTHYVNNVAGYDHPIRIAYLASLAPNPTISIPAKATLKGLKFMQLREHYLYLKSIYKSPYCTKIQKSVYLRSPFKLKGLTFSRYPDQTTILRRRRWKVILPPRSLRTGVMKTNYHFNGISLKRKTKEYSLKAMSLLN